MKEINQTKLSFLYYDLKENEKTRLKKYSEQEEIEKSLVKLLKKKKKLLKEIKEVEKNDE